MIKLVWLYNMSKIDTSIENNESCYPSLKKYKIYQYMCLRSLERHDTVMLTRPLVWKKKKTWKKCEFEIV